MCTLTSRRPCVLGLMLCSSSKDAYDDDADDDDVGHNDGKRKKRGGIGERGAKRKGEGDRRKRKRGGKKREGVFMFQDLVFIWWCPTSEEVG